MPDIAMCCNKACPKRSKCYRYLAVPCQFRQPYMQMAPDPATGECPYFWEAMEGPGVRAVEEVDATVKDFFKKDTPCSPTT
jgi:hypothetical protein